MTTKPKIKLRIKLKAFPRLRLAPVIVLPGLTRLNVPAERVLTAALSADLEGVVLMGYDQAGEEYFASTYADGGDVLWLLERLKRLILNRADQIAERGN